jgi:hypothetical protein
LDFIWQARRLRQRAEELRVVADLMTNAATGATFLSLARDYDRMADQAERLVQRQDAPLAASN